jgi:tetratricopeptide (TPR) repeat protein/tRNA A-37 threonylcarbamoyl transferase component Bud32
MSGWQPAAGSDPLIGRTIGYYEVIARVGGGSMGVVYKARHTRLNHTRALKFLEPRLSHDEEAQVRFRQEAEAASATDHPNVCTIYDLAHTDDGQLFIVMAFYEGQTLKQRLATGPMAVDEALAVATEIAAGLGAAHAKTVIHRDVKPGNLMLTEHGVRILDFGLATFVDALHLTGPAAPVGTLAYMAPEQMSGGGADARSDVWAVGVILYEMLSGRRPFDGDADGLMRAVCHQTPPPLRSLRPDVPETVEQIVFRTLLRDPAFRFQNGHDLARALREARGLTLPIPVPPRARTAPSPSPPRRHRRRAIAASAAAVAMAVGLVAGVLLWPGTRRAIAVVPVVNRTGYAELEPYRLGLTEALSSALSVSDVVRVVEHDQRTTVLRGILDGGRDPASGEAVQSLRSQTGAEMLVVVTLVNEGAGFRARVQLRSVGTSTDVGTPYETPAEVSALVKQSAFRLLRPAAEAVDERVAELASWPVRVRRRLRMALGLAERMALATRTIDAQASFEEGLRAVEDLEYGAALAAFDRASSQDTLNATLTAWRSRVARIMRHDTDAARLAREARALLTDGTPAHERWFVEAVAAESSGDLALAGLRYEAMRDARPDGVGAQIELASFLDREGRNADAIAAYHRALDLDPRLLRPHLELCRLYNRVNQPANAREHGRRSVAGFSLVGARSGHAQARMCLTDSLRVGNEAERAEAVSHAVAALDLIKTLGQPYNLPRAYNYLALAKEAQGDLGEAADAWQLARTAAEAGGNAVIEPLVLMNLGATSDKLGRAAQAVDLFRRSAAGFEALGDQSRAAENQFNAGTMLIQYGGDPAEGVRNVQNALEVFRQLGNRTFEVRAAHVMSTYYRQAGRLVEAERELNRAVSLASERDLDFPAAITAIRLAQVWLDAGDYERARRTLEDALPLATTRNGLEARIYLARTYLRLGGVARAVALLDSVGQEIRADRDAGLLPLLHAVRGDLALETGRLPDALRQFEAGAALLTTELPDVDALYANALRASLAAQAGRVEEGSGALRQSHEVAMRIGNIALATLAQVLSAEIDVRRGAFDRALTDLEAIPPDSASLQVPAELRMRAHHWAGRAWAGKGDTSAASEHAASAWKALDALAQRIPETSRSAFLARPGMAGIRP